MKETIKRKKSALRTILEMMEVPAMRLDLDKPSNLRWLIRNLAVRNKSHPLLDTAIEMVHWIRKMDTNK